MASSQPQRPEWPETGQDDALRPALGIMLGVVIGLAMWAMILGLCAIL